MPEANTAVHLEKIWYNSITNERGEVGTIGGGSTGPGNREGVTINPAFIEQSQRLKVKIAKLPYALNGSWLLEIELNNSGGKQR